MSESQPMPRVVELAQYLTGLTATQDVWGEASRAVVSLLGADWCAVAARDDAGVPRMQAWAFADATRAADWSLVSASVGPGGQSSVATRDP